MKPHEPKKKEKKEPKKRGEQRAIINQIKKKRKNNKTLSQKVKKGGKNHRYQNHIICKEHTPRDTTMYASCDLIHHQSK
jgi:hypothetical protein